MIHLLVLYLKLRNENQETSSANNDSSFSSLSNQRTKAEFHLFSQSQEPLDNTRLFISLTAGAGTRCMSLLSSPPSLGNEMKTKSNKFRKIKNKFCKEDRITDPKEWITDQELILIPTNGSPLTTV